MAEERNRTLSNSGFVNTRKLPKGPNGRALCRRCGQEVPVGRKSFCGDACIHEWKLRSDPGYAAAQVLRRDRGICCLCGTDCLALQLEWRRLWTEWNWSPDRLKLQEEWLAAKGVPRSRLGGKRLWDMDHTTPVVEGGGTCGLDNLRTLCIPCHRAQTKALAARRAQARKAAKEGQSAGPPK
jgi:5-methylcytosine-specific restriction protein A